MIQKLLIAYDGSESARAAFEFGYSMAKQYGAQLHIVAVAQPPEFGSDVETEAVIEQGRENYRHILLPLRQRLAKESMDAVFDVLIGHPAEQIVRYAEMHHIDHIVVGHRGRTLFERWLIGSVARQILVYAPCSVTMVRAEDAR